VVELTQIHLATREDIQAQQTAISEKDARIAELERLLAEKS
jgi:hypothetical protein